MFKNVGTHKCRSPMSGFSALLMIMGVVSIEVGLEALAPHLNQQLDTIVISLGAVNAQQARSSSQAKRERKVPNVNLQTYERLAEVEELVKEKDLQGGLDILERMLARGERRYNGNELAQIHNSFAFVYYALDDVDKTIYHNEQILTFREDIREGQEMSTIYQLSQLYFSVENFEKSLEYLNDWFVLELDPSPQAYNFLATVQYTQKDYESAAESMETAIALAIQKGYLPIKKNWWALLKYLHHELENYPRVIEILTIIVREYPDRNSWVQLASTYNQMGELDKALYAYECAHALGFFDRQLDYQQLNAFLMNADIYIRAAWVGQEGFDKGLMEDTYRNHNSLAQAYEAAWETEKAIAEYEKAAELAEDGKIDQRLSRLYTNTEDFDRCVSHADAALEKGGVKRQYTVKLNKGMCQFWNKELANALKTFTESRNEARKARDASSEKWAADWIKFVRNEKNRLDKIAASDKSY